MNVMENAAQTGIASVPQLVDGYGRRIRYLRMSVTDRCDFRCVYCMSENMQFLPRQQVLTLEELYQVAKVFSALGVDKIRLTGGEPLVRHNIVSLIARMAQLPGLRELVLTTNGSQLVTLAEPLRDAGVSRLNISLDSLQPERFRQLTRSGDLHQVLAGIDAARRAGFRGIKLNAVIMRGRNEDEVLPLLDYALQRDLDITYIEEMPLGVDMAHRRQETHFSSAEVRSAIAERYNLFETPYNSLGPARYFQVQGYARSRVGFISPHTHNFCDTCNRVRLTPEGRLLLCLGQENSLDLKRVLRANPGDDERLRQAIEAAIARKPYGHDFNLRDDVQVVRFMNMTGG